MSDAQSVPETELLFQRDSYLRTIETRVVAVDAEARQVALERTVF